MLYSGSDRSISELLNNGACWPHKSHHSSDWIHHRSLIHNLWRCPPSPPCLTRTLTLQTMSNSACVGSSVERGSVCDLCSGLEPEWIGQKTSWAPLAPSMKYLLQHSSTTCCWSSSTLYTITPPQISSPWDLHWPSEREKEWLMKKERRWFKNWLLWHDLLWFLGTSSPPVGATGGQTALWSM